jgi:hypothetical protein
MSEVETLVLARRAEAMRRVKDADLMEITRRARRLLAQLA